MSTHTWIVTEEKHARRIVSHLMTRRMFAAFEVSYLEGEYHIGLPQTIDLTRLRTKLKGVDFRIE